jgi:Tol biopolymer transport system component
LEKYSNGKMNMKKILIVLSICILLAGVQTTLALSTLKKANQPNFTNENFILEDLVKEDGYRVDWSHNLDRIAFDHKEADGYYDIYTMNPDGTDEQCLTNNPTIPQGHKGCAAWHLSGDYIVFTCEKEKYFGKHMFILSRMLSKLAVPGEGINCDLWLMNSDGSEFWQLTDIKTKTRLFDRQPYTGVLHPHFSHDGKKIFWTERVGRGAKWGEWTLNIADFVTEGGNPCLENITTYQPGNTPCFYESHGFSVDDKKIIFCGNLEAGQDENHIDIYTLDLETEELVRLTDSIDEWDEHAHYSPDGEKIVWMSSNGHGMNTARKWWNYLKTDYWTMNADGSNKTQLTFYNSDPGDDMRVICSDCSWNADGTKLATTMLIIDGDDVTGGIAILDFYICGNTIEEKSGAAEKYVEEYTVDNITTITEYGGRVDWSHSGNNLIAFDRKENDKYYDIYTMKPDGSDEICLTCDHPDLPNRNIGQPAWHPSGEYIVLQVEKEEHRRTFSIATNPGAGHFNDLWVLNVDTGDATLLFEVPNDKNYGVLHPHFSNDGTKLSWSEMYEKPSFFQKDKAAGYWKLKVADFVVPTAGAPMLENISEFMSGEMAFYENHGFSPNDTN